MLSFYQRMVTRQFGKSPRRLAVYLLVIVTIQQSSVLLGSLAIEPQPAEVKKKTRDNNTFLLPSNIMKGFDLGKTVKLELTTKGQSRSSLELNHSNT